MEKMTDPDWGDLNRAIELCMAQTYKGPCKFGWMHKDNVEPAAG